MASAKQYISPFISLYFKPLFLVFISVLSKLSKGSLRQGGLRCCSLENIYLLFYEAPIVPKFLRTIDGVAVKSIGCDALIGWSFS